jgi:hypothetical protein
MSMKNSNDTTGNQYHDLPVCSTVPQPMHYRVPPIARMGEIGNMYKSLIQKTNMKVTLGRQKAQMEKKALKWIFRKVDGRVCAVCSCEWHDILSGSVTGREFIKQLSKYQHLLDRLGYRALIAQWHDCSETATMP